MISPGSIPLNIKVSRDVVFTVRTAIAAPIATNVDIIFSSSIDKNSSKIMDISNLMIVYRYSIASLINSDVKNTNTYA